MAKALPSGRVTHRRALFGALDADGWTWATLKATFWFIAIIMLLGYIPDRAYYFTVNRTVDLGIMVWSPVNLCPGENGGLPCPAPAGALVPWQPQGAPSDLPDGRTNGSAAQMGSNLLYIGGSNGSAPTANTSVAKLDNGIPGAWGAGPDLPAARQGAGVAVLNGTAFLVGGTGPDGAPTTTVWQLAADPQSGALGAWAPVGKADQPLALPEARTGAAVLAVSDGLLVAGGTGPDGKPSTKVWKSTADAKTGVLGAFAAQPDLPDGVTNASIAFTGTFVWVYGGTDANGPSGAVQRGDFGVPGSAPAASGAAPAASGAASSGGAAAPSPAGSAAPVPSVVLKWTVDNALNVAPRTGAAGFTANGSIYVVGGNDGTNSRSEVYWATPDANGNLPGGWLHLPVSDLPAGGIQGASAVTSGANVLLIGGSTSGGILKSVERASTAPQEPFFQLGIAGVVVPALQIPGEIGQQLGYLSAAGAGTVNFIILAVIGWMYANRPKVRAWWNRRRGRHTA
jgi:N-acetylneuraminic acid mutarotase